LGETGDVMKASAKVQGRFAAVSESLAALGKATGKRKAMRKGVAK